MIGISETGDAFMGQIKHDIELEMKSSYELKQAGEQLETVRNDMRTMSDDIALMWNDEHGSKMSVKTRILAAQLSDLVFSLGEITENIEKKAKLFYEAEKEAEKITSSE